jgi:hypothetical protein
MDSSPSFLAVEKQSPEREEISGDCKDKNGHCGNHYRTEPRTKIDFRNICMYLKSKEISCQKYNYSLASLVQNQDHYFATIQLSKDGKKLMVENLKPNEYKVVENLYSADAGDAKKQEFLSQEKRKEMLIKKFKRKQRMSGVEGIDGDDKTENDNE